MSAGLPSISPSGTRQTLKMEAGHARRCGTCLLLLFTATLQLPSACGVPIGRSKPGGGMGAPRRENPVERPGGGGGPSAPFLTVHTTYSVNVTDSSDQTGASSRFRHTCRQLRLDTCATAPCFDLPKFSLLMCLRVCARNSGRVLPDSVEWDSHAQVWPDLIRARL
jgi:hypothetical protein